MIAALTVLVGLTVLVTVAALLADYADSVDHDIDDLLDHEDQP